METREFGTRLRELRKQAGFSQRELADRIGVNFSYLSKIESGAMPPPSEQVILRLAEVLNADRDELMLLAGKIPSDIAQMLRNQKALQLLRSDRTQKKLREAVKNDKKKRVSTMKKLINYKSLSRIAVPIVLVCAIAASLWFVSPLPAKALEISFPSPPSAGTLGQTHNFTIKMDIADAELLPIQSIDMEIYNVSDPSKKATCTNLPLTETTKAYTSTQTGGGAASVTATVSNWAWGYGYGYTDWKGMAYYFNYGYGYGSGAGAASITYAITWTSPSGWPEADYEVLVKITADSETFTHTSSTFKLSAAAAGPVGAPPAPTAQEVEPGVWNVSYVVNTEAVFIVDATIASADDKVSLDINKHTVGKTEEGEALSQISILEMAEPPAPSENASVIGLTYDLLPDRATFNPAITITFTYDADELPEGFDEENLVIAIWDETAGKWVNLENCIVDPVTHTIRASVSHFTAFSVLAYIPRPAGFSFSALSIYPTEVYIGQTVTIRASVTNTGDLSGSYEVTLKIDNVVVETKEVTLAGGASQTVSFTTAKDAAGTYFVNVNGLAGTFTVKVEEEEEEVPPEPAAFTIGTLTISPAEVDIGDSVTINAVVTNTGDISDSYEVTLKIDNVVVETKEVTVAGGTSQTVSFTTAKDAAGTYSVNVNGLSSTFTVKVKEAPAAPEEGIAWWIWLIVGIAAVVVIGLLAYFLWWRRRF